jgi:hypothetical protein
MESCATSRSCLRAPHPCRPNSLAGYRVRLPWSSPELPHDGSEPKLPEVIASPAADCPGSRIDHVRDERCLPPHDRSSDRNKQHHAALGHHPANAACPRCAIQSGTCMYLLIAGLLVRVQLGSPNLRSDGFARFCCQDPSQKTPRFTARLIRRAPDPRSRSALPHQACR